MRNNYIKIANFLKSSADLGSMPGSVITYPSNATDEKYDEFQLHWDKLADVFPEDSGYKIQDIKALPMIGGDCPSDVRSDATTYHIDIAKNKVYQVSPDAGVVSEANADAALPVIRDWFKFLQALK
jgi:hypothetical protein